MNIKSLLNSSIPLFAIFASQSKRQKTGESFKMLRTVLRDDEGILCNTLYRYLVLFGIPSESPFPPTNSVWNCILKHLNHQATARTSRRTKPSQVSAATQFALDRSKYSLEVGTDPLISRARERLQSVPGAWEVLHSLTNFNPQLRQSLYSVIRSPIFASMIGEESTEKIFYLCSTYANKNGHHQLVNV